MFQGCLETLKLATLKPRSNTYSLHAASLWRTAAVVRNRRDVANGTHFNTRRRQRTDSRLTARSRTTDPHIDAAHSVIPRHARGIRRRLLGRERRALARSAKAERSEI